MSFSLAVQSDSTVTWPVHRVNQAAVLGWMDWLHGHIRAARRTARRVCER